MGEIQLTQGQVAIIDDVDFDLVSQHKWYAHCKRGTWEAATAITHWGRISLGRYLMGCTEKDGKRVYHINGDRLDCRRENLAFVEKNRIRIVGNAVYIALHGGKEAIVDLEDYACVRKYVWHESQAQGGICYVAGYLKDSNSKLLHSLHRVILGLKAGGGTIVDHVNRNGLDNRRCNLRICSRRDNARNQKSHKDAKHSRYKGVTKMPGKRKKCWVSRIIVNYKQVYLGYYETETEAARAYDQGAWEYYGEFARLNFPDTLVDL